MPYDSKMFKETKNPYGNKNFRDILDFYLFHCPSQGKSVRSITFEEQGWKGNLFSTFKSQMLNRASSDLKKHYFPCEKKELIDKFMIAKTYKKNEEYCIFLKNDETRIIESLFSAIRNSLAHGSFFIKKESKVNYYFFINHDGYLKAEIRLREDTLQNWIFLFNSDPHAMKKRN